MKPQGYDLFAGALLEVPTMPTADFEVTPGNCQLTEGPNQWIIVLRTIAKLMALRHPGATPTMAILTAPLVAPSMAPRSTIHISAGNPKGGKVGNVGRHVAGPAARRAHVASRAQRARTPRELRRCTGHDGGNIFSVLLTKTCPQCRPDRTICRGAAARGAARHRHYYSSHLRCLRFRCFYHLCVAICNLELR